MLVKEVMIPCTTTLNSGATIEEAWRAIIAAGTRGLPVFNKNGLIGMIERERIFAVGPNININAYIDELIDREVVALSPESNIENVLKIPKSIFPVIDDDGNIIGMLDKESMDQPLYSRAMHMIKQIEAVLDSAHNGIIAVNKDGVVTIFNRAAEQITRRPKDQAIGRHLSKVIIPQGLLEIIKEGKTLMHYKFTVKYSQGPHIYVTNRTPIIEDGKVVGAIGVFQDISDFEFISAELSSVKALNKELEAILESSYDGILVTDAKGIIIKANQGHQRITGIPSANIQGSLIDELVKMGIYSEPIVQEVIQKKKAVTYCNRSFNNKYLVITGSPVYDVNNEIIRVVINVRDLTELNELKQRLEESLGLSESYQHELKHLRNRLYEQDGVVCRSHKMQDLLSMVTRVAQVDSTVLILGESGVGKEVIARLLHKNSQRASGPFITVNCGAIPENLLESELFGYERGAFTGANKEGKPGLFELANHGTLFLDEIGDLPLHFQVKILRAIQSREIIRVGGNRVRHINLRIIAATNKNLKQMVNEGGFREDLYFRINVVPLHVPSLRERKEDIIPLSHHFLNQFNLKYNIRKEISPDVFEVMLEYSWPGNVRELENIIERLVVTVSDQIIRASDLPSYLLKSKQIGLPEVLVKGILPLKQARLEMEKQLITNALSEYGSTYAVARALKVDQSTIVRKLQKIRDL